MILAIPIFVQEQMDSDGRTRFTAKPLFARPGPRAGHKLSTVLAQLGGDLRQHFRQLQHDEDHQRLADESYCPAVCEHRCAFTLRLRRKSAVCNLTCVEFAALGRRLGLIPALPDLWFELSNRATVTERVREVLEDHFRAAEDDQADGSPEKLAQLEKSGRGWVTVIDLDLPPLASKDRRKTTSTKPFAFLDRDDVASGYAELTQVGRCLDWLFPDDLDRAELREPQVAELIRMLESPDRRPIVLLGACLAGKTAILHEAVHRRVGQRKNRSKYGKNVWLLSPGRLIAGMSYVGQWEQRMLAILREAKNRDHVLYFDDMIGLYRAGLSSGSKLSVAHVLKPAVERGHCRVIAEVTPEAWRVFQEMDRGFADMFHVIRVDEPGERDVLSMLIAVMRRLESRHECRFDVEAIPAVIDLQRRYARDTALPGKAALMLGTLAVKHAKSRIGAAEAVAGFHEASGLAMSLLNDESRLTHEGVREAIQQRVVGQRDAVGAMADVVVTAKARLNDPGRPVASLLFLGPTGVGKTQCAKALAGYLFGDGSRLIRFDMNEFLTAAAVSRLTGSPDAPDGLLISAVRRQPFAVLLLDEIEKAHPAAFDLLLQVLGEARLTNARGQTADFSNTVIVMTSNLGAERVGASLGFEPPSRRQPKRLEAFVAEAERFFRPEFLNRIDRIVAFNTLERQDMRRVADLLMRDVLGRDGLRQRRCILQVHPESIERIVDEGYQPELGARALKRTLERQLMQPIAAHLAAIKPGAPTVIRVHPAPRGIKVHTQELRDAERLELPIDALDLQTPRPVVEALTAALRRIEAALDRRAPADQVSGAGIAAEHTAYFCAREQASRVRAQLRRITDTLAKPRFTKVVGGVRSRLFRSPDEVTRSALEALQNAGDLSDFIRQAPAAEDDPRGTASRLKEALRETALLELMLDDLATEAPSRSLLILSAFNPDDKHPELQTLCDLYLRCFSSIVGYSASVVADKQPGIAALLLEGPGVTRIAAGEIGTQLAVAAGGLVPFRVDHIAVPAGESHDALLRAHLRQHADAAQAAIDDDDAAHESMALPPVMRVLDRLVLVDQRTGIVQRQGRFDLRPMILAYLPLPAELTEGD